MRDRISSDTSLVAIEEQIHLIRGRRVVLSADWAKFFGVSAKRLKEQVKRNKGRFPPDFMFQLTDQEVTSLRSQIATLNGGKRGYDIKSLLFAFTEHGAVMAAKCTECILLRHRFQMPPLAFNW